MFFGIIDLITIFPASHVSVASTLKECEYYKQECNKLVLYIGKLYNEFDQKVKVIS